MIKRKEHIALYFGSFNPVHVGHLALANYMAENISVDQIWFVVSPQNPHKESSELIDAVHRIKMLELSIHFYDKFSVCDIELHLPTPSYTYRTLRTLRKNYPDKHFSIILGGDNLQSFNRWKNTEEIIGQCIVYVFPRPGYEVSKSDVKKKHFKVIDAPFFDIDSTLM
jgi:nicotinate-nucleotide adenylyltransferase